MWMHGSPRLLLALSSPAPSTMTAERAGSNPGTISQHSEMQFRAQSFCTSLLLYPSPPRSTSSCARIFQPTGLCGLGLLSLCRTRKSVRSISSKIPSPVFLGIPFHLEDAKFELTLPLRGLYNSCHFNCHCCCVLPVRHGQVSVDTQPARVNSEICGFKRQCSPLKKVTSTFQPEKEIRFQWPFRQFPS